MTTLTSAQPALIDILWPRATDRVWLRNIALAIAGTLVLTLSAKIQVPFWPVPMTMQTFAVLVIAMAFGPRLGTATVALYLVEGAVGLPVFAGSPATGIGPAYMAGPTGGYLAGFLAASAVLGYLNGRGWDCSVFKTVGAMVLGTVIIFVLGYVWLAYLIGMENAWTFGIQPFLPAAAFKIALAAAVLPTAWKVLGNKGRARRSWKRG